MHYALLLHNAEPAEGQVSAEAMTQMQDAFGAYLTSLHEAGVLRAADILAPAASSTTLTLRTGSLQVQDGPFAVTKEALAGAFVIDVPDLDAALGWAEKCPAASYAVIEVRPAATWAENGRWSTPECPIS